MSTLKRQEPLGPGLRRIACEDLEAAIRSLTQPAGDAPATLHQVARLDAVLRLIEPVLPRPTARRDRAVLDRLRGAIDDLARPAMALARLEAHFKKAPDDPPLAEAVKALRKRLSAQSRPGLVLNTPGKSFDPMIYRLVADMAELRGHVGGWPVDAMDDDAPPPGLRRTYQQTRKLAAAPPADRDLPALAAAATALAEQLSIFSKACPAMLKGQRKLLAAAIEPLNAAAVDMQLGRLLREQATDGLTADTIAAALPAASIHGTIDAALAPALAESTAAFDRRVKAYWSAWRTKAP